jgi:hypothetical protein
MSRCVLDDEGGHYSVAIGWDPPMRTFFAQVLDNTIHGEDSEKEVFWSGGVDGERYTDPWELIERIQAYARKHDADQLYRELVKDKDTDSERHYSLDETGIAA